MKLEGRKKELAVNAIQKYKKDLQDLLLWDDCNLITQVLDEIYVEIKEENSGNRKRQD